MSIFDNKNKNKTVLLIHGLSGSSFVLGKKGSDKTQLVKYPHGYNSFLKSTFCEMPEWLDEDGFDIYFMQYITNKDSSPSLESNILLLGKYINEILKINPKAEIEIIAHSIGGFIARGYTEGPLYKTQRIKFKRQFLKHVFYLGSAFNGFPYNKWFKWIVSFYKDDSKYALEETMDNNYVKLFDETFSENPEKVKSYAIAGIYCDSGIGKSVNKLCRIIGSENDGCCTVESALNVPEATQKATIPESHAKVFGYSYFNAQKGRKYSYAYEYCIRPVIVGGDDLGCKGISTEITRKKSEELLFGLVAYTVIAFVNSLSGIHGIARKFVKIDHTKD